MCCYSHTYDVYPQKVVDLGEGGQESYINDERHHGMMKKIEKLEQINMQLCNREGWKEEADQMCMKEVKRGMYTVV